MPARVSCPNCGAVPKAADELPPGKKIECRKCGTAYRVPDRRPSRAGSGGLVLALVAVAAGGLLLVGAAAVAGLYLLAKPSTVAQAPKAFAPNPQPAQQQPPGEPPPVAGRPPAGGQPPAGSEVGLTAEITGEDIDGRPFKLSDYRGKVVLLDFWGHW